jgi:cell wall-associated NlpC family hydrolase
LPSDDPLQSDVRFASDAARSSATAATSDVARSSRPEKRQHGRHRRRLLGLLLPIALGVSAILSMTSATAAPRPTIAQVERSVNRLQSQAEQASENYDEAREQLKSVNVRLKAAQVKLSRQQTQVAQARRQLGWIAAETYRQGQFSTLEVVLSDDPEAALAQAGYLPSLGERQADVLVELKAGEQDLLSTETMIKQQHSRAESARNKMKATRTTVLKRLAQVKAQLAKLKGPERSELLNNQNHSQGGDVPSGAGTAFCIGKAAQAPSAAAKTAITFACNQIGDPYQWAADGPGSFDCSGLTMRAYGAAGISLPHSSRLQASSGTSVAVSAIEPGDLLFFGSPIHHVAIYLGGGLMVHAPDTGDVVKVASVYQTPVAAVRL